MTKYYMIILLLLTVTITSPTFAQEYAKPNLTELHRAAFYGKNDLVAFYAQNGADLNALAGNDNTPLHIATVKGQSEAVRILLTYGADKTIKNIGGKTPLDIAKEKNFPSIVELLESDLY